MRLLLLAASLAAAAGCAPGQTAPPEGGAAQAPVAEGPVWMQAWRGLDRAAASLDGHAPEACERFETWFTAFGVRGLACLADHAAPAPLLAGTPAAPFTRGPHGVSEGTVRLELERARDFGHYDPAFVRWLAAEAIPEGRMVTATQPVYERHAARLARVYWLTRQDLARAGYPASTPAGPLKAYASFLEGQPAPRDVLTPDGGFSPTAFSDRSARLLPAIGLPLENEWFALYEANTAYGFWLRRRADGTEALWRDALRTLLERYDADWLVAQGA